MATPTGSESIVKRRLRNTPMYINRIQSKNQIVFFYAKWKIYRFRKLKNGIHYKSYLSELNWHLYLYKDRQNLSVKVVPGDFKKTIECSLVYAPEAPRLRVQETGRYEYHIPFATIQDSKNKYYEEDSLCFEFKFEKISETTPAVSPIISARNDEEVYKLKNEIYDLLVSARLKTNFVLRLNNRDVGVRKDILSARCKFFYDYFKENPDSMEYQLDTTHEMMIRVYAYMLTGTISAYPKPQEIIDCLILAVFLKIPSLQSQCERALGENMNRDNAHTIRDVGVKTGIKSLVRWAENFLGENCNLTDFDKSVENILSKWKKAGHP